MPAVTAAFELGLMTTSALAVMAVAVMIPLDDTQELGNLLIRSGADNSLALICMAMEILSVLSLVGSAVSLGKNRYYLLALMLLLIIAGTDMAFFTARPLVIPGAALLTAGFIGKFYLFAAVLDKEWFWLAIIAALNSVVGLYYYFKVVKALFLMRPAEGADTSPLKLHWLQYTVLGVLAVPTLILGLYWGQFKDLADTAIAAMTVGF